MTLDAGLTLTQDIHDVWNGGFKSTVLMFDITGFFNFVNHNILTLRLQQFSFHPKGINIIKGFPTSWHTRITYDNYHSDPLEIPNSISQGSPLSPILSILYSTVMSLAHSVQPYTHLFLLFYQFHYITEPPPHTPADPMSIHNLMHDASSSLYQTSLTYLMDR